jgi:hypothetical protein
MTNEWKDPPAPVSHQTDWAAFKAAIAPVETIDEPALVKQKSRDFYWYSPVLKRLASPRRTNRDCWAS